MFKELRTSYKPPNRKQLSSDLLDEVHEEVNLGMIEKLKSNNTYLTLCQDWWSSRSNQPIVAQSHFISDGKKSYLI